MVAYRFEDSRSGDCVARHLDGYRGILQVNGYAAYNRLGKDRGDKDAVTLAGCWAHARRKFFDLHASNGSPFAGAVVKASRHHKACPTKKPPTNSHCTWILQCCICAAGIGFVAEIWTSALSLHGIGRLYTPYHLGGLYNAKALSHSRGTSRFIECSLRSRLRRS